MRRAERKKYLAGLIAVVLLSAIMPITALAASAGYGDFLVTGDDLSGVSFENNMLKIDTSGTYTISMAQEGTTTGQHIAVSPGVKATLVLNGVSVSSATTALEIRGADVTLILSSGSDNSFVSTGAGNSAIHVPSGSVLTIRCDSNEDGHVCDENCGSLMVQYATNTLGPAAIGGNTAESTGSISIQGGTVNASNNYGTAIGGGSGQFYSGNSSGGAATVSISGGIVTATSSYNNTAIGGGTGGDGAGAGGTGTPGMGGSDGQAVISITGGVVNTQGGAIGGGNGGAGGYNFWESGGTGGAGGNAEIALTGGIVNAGRIGAGEGGAGGGGSSAGPSGVAGSGPIETGTEGSCFVIADRLITSSDETGFTGAFVIAGNGKVYSDVSLYTDVILPEGATLAIPEGTVLTIPADVTFTNDGSIVGQGEIDNYGLIYGNQPGVTVNEMMATISLASSEGGSVTGGGNFETGSDVAVTATPEEGYHFLGWTENGKLVSDSARYEFSVTADRNLTAVFEQHKGQDDGDCTTPVYCGIYSSVVRAAQEHQFGEWISGNGTHTRRCKNENCNVTEEAPCTGGIATCTEKAVCEICGGKYGEPEAANHTKLVKVEAKSPTQTQEGNIAYWHCEACGRYFSDEVLTNEITVEDTIISAGNIPQTGDSGRVFLWSILLLISGSVAGVAIYKKHKA